MCLPTVTAAQRHSTAAPSSCRYISRLWPLATVTTHECIGLWEAIELGGYGEEECVWASRDLKQLADPVQPQSSVHRILGTKKQNLPYGTALWTHPPLQLATCLPPPGHPPITLSAPGATCSSPAPRSLGASDCLAGLPQVLSRELVNPL